MFSTSVRWTGSLRWAQYTITTDSERYLPWIFWNSDTHLKCSQFKLFLLVLKLGPSSSSNSELMSASLLCLYRRKDEGMGVGEVCRYLTDRKKNDTFQSVREADCRQKVFGSKLVNATVSLKLVLTLLLENLGYIAHEKNINLVDCDYCCCCCCLNKSQWFHFTNRDWGARCWGKSPLAQRGRGRKNSVDFPPQCRCPKRKRKLSSPHCLKNPLNWMFLPSTSCASLSIHPLDPLSLSMVFPMFTPCQLVACSASWSVAGCS